MAKRILCILCAIVCLSFLPASLAEDDGPIYFDATFTNVMDYDQNKWTESDLYRAIFAVMITVDYMAQDDEPFDLVGLATGIVYVGNQNQVMILGYTADDQSKESIVILYDTAKNEAAYKVYKQSGVTAKFFLDTAMKEVCTGGYTILSESDLRTALTLLQEVLSEVGSN
jgi:hypothetical protein